MLRASLDKSATMSASTAPGVADWVVEHAADDEQHFACMDGPTIASGEAVTGYKVYTRTGLVGRCTTVGMD